MKKLALLFAISLCSCLSEPSTDISLDRCQNLAEPHGLYVAEPVLWDIRDLIVCWDNESDVGTDHSTWVQEAITDTWQKHSSMKFIYWQDCKTLKEANIEPNVEIVTWMLPVNGTLGLGDRTVSNVTVVLSKDLSYTVRRDLCKNQEECSKIIAVHEFGHVLGFAHEQNREDTPIICKMHHEPQGPNGTLQIGRWDPYSVMNYCNSNWDGDGRLSCNDIMGLQQVYGKPE